jgi:2,3-bisphosphoglycerate-independent phosphoglycerate mutase
MPKGSKARELAQLMEDSRWMLDGHEVNRERRAAGQKPAIMLWLWGQGRPPAFEPFKKKYGLDGAVISAVDLIQGLGIATGMEVVKVKGATGWIDTNFSGKAEACLQALKKKDFVFLHFEVTDEAGHKGDHETKVKGLEEIDLKVLGPIVEGLKGQEFRIMCLPDHPTPLETRTHAFEPVPYFIYDSSEAGPASGLLFDEESARSTGKHLVEGWELMGRFVVA